MLRGSLPALGLDVLGNAEHAGRLFFRQAEGILREHLLRERVAGNGPRRRAARRQRTGQTVTMKTFSTVKRTACLRGSSRKKARDTQMSDGSTPRATPEMNMVSWTSSEIPSGTSKW